MAEQEEIVPNSESEIKKLKQKKKIRRTKVFCPLIQDECLKACVFYMPTDKDGGVPFSLAFHYGCCWVKYYLMIMARK